MTPPHPPVLDYRSPPPADAPRPRPGSSVDPAKVRRACGLAALAFGVFAVAARAVLPPFRHVERAWDGVTYLLVFAGATAALILGRRALLGWRADPVRSAALLVCGPVAVLALAAQASDLYVDPAYPRPRWRADLFGPSWVAGSAVVAYAGFRLLSAVARRRRARAPKAHREPATPHSGQTPLSLPVRSYAQDEHRRGGATDGG